MSPSTEFADERLDGASPITATACLLDPDVRVVTSDGKSIPAHSRILGLASPVLESILDRAQKHHRGRTEKVVPILGVPYDAVSAFIGFLYSSSRYTEQEMTEYGIHLLALSHVYSVPRLKQICTRSLAERLTVENVIDVLQLARLCDAPDLYLKCMKLVSDRFRAVEDTEAWKFLHKYDPRFELEILQCIDEAEKRKKRSRRHKEEQRLYMEINEAMECLVHICTEGCTGVGPSRDAQLLSTVSNSKRSSIREPCVKFSTCQGLQLLIKHFACCDKRVNGGCSRCKRMWQLLRLHASICDEPDHCKVPLCRKFKLRMEQEKRGGDGKWRVLVRKVMSARTLSSLAEAKRRREARATKDHHHHHHQPLPLPLPLPFIRGQGSPVVSSNGASIWRPIACS